MSIKRTIITTLVALALVAVVAPVVASSPSCSALQAQMNALSTIGTLQGTSTHNQWNNTWHARSYIHKKLDSWFSGADVKCMQALLNQNGYQVSTTGAGSPGMETTTFGPKDFSCC